MKEYLWAVLLAAALVVGCQKTESYEPAATTDAPEPIKVAQVPKAPPAPKPVPASLKLNKSVYAPGEKIVATFAGGPGNSDDWIGIIPAGVKPGPDDTGILCWLYTDGSQDGWSSAKSGTVTLDDDSVNEGDEWPLAQGKYDVYFCCCNGYDSLVTPVTITVAKPVPPSLKLNKSVYAPGEKIVATFAGGPGNSDDWIGIIPAGVKPGPDDTGILCWLYTDGSQDGWSSAKSGTVTLDGDSVNEGDEWPLAEGKYDVYFCCCEGYDPLATPVTITVAKPVPPSLKLNKSVYAPGEKIVATFAGGPGNSDDWIGIIPAGVKPGPDDTGILCWLYTDGSQDGWSSAKSGTVTLDGDSVNQGDEWPLAQGKYDVYFCCCEGYDPLVTPVTITVTSKP